MSKSNHPADTEYFKYVNKNPSGWHCGDCVIRALSEVLNRSWEEIYNDLYKIGIKKHRMPNDDKVVHKYLIDNGFVKCNMPRKIDNSRYTVCEYLRNQKYGALNMLNDSRPIFASVGTHHVTAIIYDSFGYRVHDIWNSSNEKLGYYYIKTLKYEEA